MMCMAESLSVPSRYYRVLRQSFPFRQMASGLFLLGLLQVSPGQTCVAPPSGLVSWWRGEGTGTDAVGGNHGTLVGDATYTFGKPGIGFALDGNGDGVLVGSADNLQLQDFTIEAWIQRASTSIVSVNFPNAALFGFGSGGYGLGIWYNGTLYLTQWDVGNVATAYAITDLSFHH